MLRLKLIGVAVVLLTVALTSNASAMAAPTAIRVGYFANTGPVDVYVDGASAGTIPFMQVTKYLEVAPGAHMLALRPAGSPSTSAPTYQRQVVADANGYYTVIVVANADKTLSSAEYTDDLTDPPAGQARVRVVHAVTGTAGVDVYVTPKGQTVSTKPAFSDIGFNTASPYANLAAGTYNVEIHATGDTKAVLMATSWPAVQDSVASVVVFPTDKGVTVEVLRDDEGRTMMGNNSSSLAFTGSHDTHRPILLASLLLVLGAGFMALGRRRRPPPGTQDVNAR